MPNFPWRAEGDRRQAISARSFIVPFKHRSKGRRHIPRQRHRVTNWRDYDTALRNRGSLTIWLCVQRRLACSARVQTCRGKNQEPRSLDSRVAGNQDPEAYRQDLPWGDYKSPGRNKSERGSGLEKSKIRGPSLQPEGEGSMGSRNLIDAATSPRRGGMRQHGDKDMPSNWRSPPRPDEKNVGAR